MAVNFLFVVNVLNYLINMTQKVVYSPTTKELTQAFSFLSIYKIDWLVDEHISSPEAKSRDFKHKSLGK